MAIKLITEDIRVKAAKKTIWLKKGIRLCVQTKFRLFFTTIWVTKKKIDIHVEYYWGYIPGDRVFGRHMINSDSCGNVLETWPPDIFNLDNRMSELAAEYIGECANKIEAMDSVNRQMKRL